MQYHHCRHGSLTRGGDDLPLPLRVPGMQTAGTPPLDFIPHGRGGTQGNGEPAARRDVRPHVPGFRQPQQGGLAAGNERKLCALQGNRAGQPLAGQGADPRAGCRQQPLPRTREPHRNRQLAGIYQYAQGRYVAEDALYRRVFRPRHGTDVLQRLQACAAGTRHGGTPAAGGSLPSGPVQPGRTPEGCFMPLRVHGGTDGRHCPEPLREKAGFLSPDRRTPHLP